MAIPDWIGLNHVFKAFTKTKHIFQERNLKVFQLCSDPNDVFHLCLIRILVMAQLQLMLSERAPQIQVYRLLRDSRFLPIK